MANDYIARTPCRNLRLPEVRDARVRVNFEDVSQLHKLADAMPEAYRSAVYLGALGLRQAEVFGPRVGSIDFLRGTITISETLNEVDGLFVTDTGKTRNSVRAVQVPASVLDLLGRHLREHDRLAPDALVIQAPRGGPVRATNLRRRAWIPAAEATGVPGLTFHRLRHYAIQAMRDAGVPLEVASKRVGHSTIRVTADVYDAVSRASDQVATDALDGILAESRGPGADQVTKSAGA